MVRSHPVGTMDLRVWGECPGRSIDQLICGGGDLAGTSAPPFYLGNAIDLRACDAQRSLQSHAMPEKGPDGRTVRAFVLLYAARSARDRSSST